MVFCLERGADLHMAQLMPLWTNVDDKMTVKDYIFFTKHQKNTLI